MTVLAIRWELLSTSFHAIELSPQFFRWGKAWPLQQIVTASRTLLFGTRNKLGLNFGILFAWSAINTALSRDAASSRDERTKVKRRRSGESRSRG
jgi:hypothetical protein